MSCGSSSNSSGCAVVGDSASATVEGLGPLIMISAGITSPADATHRFISLLFFAHLVYLPAQKTQNILSSRGVLRFGRLFPYEAVMTVAKVTCISVC